MEKKILLIEDNLDVRENTAEILELADFNVTTAENGKVGVKLAKELLPDLIICDIMMPELDGYGVLHILSKSPETSTIPFVFLTAKAEKSDFRKGMNLGADDYLTKPFDETELMDVIEGRLKKSDAIKSLYKESETSLEAVFSSARNTANLELVSDSRKTKIFKKKEDIYREGDFPHHIFFVKSGKVKTIKTNDDGKEFITGLFNEGDYFGYESVLRELNYVDTATTLEGTELCLIPKQDFMELVFSNREIAGQFIKLLSNNVIEKEQELLDLAYNTVRKRVGDALVKLYYKYKNEEDPSFQMAISRNDLASIVGTATESVIRILSEFKDDEYIKVEGSTIKILNINALESLKY